MDDRVWQQMQSAACVLVDGTFWTDDEMIRLGVSKKHARDIGHLPQSGAGGMLEMARRPAGDAQGPDPHQQHQSDPRRGFGPGGPSSPPRHRGRLGRHGDRAVSRAEQTAPGAARSSSSGCVRRAALSHPSSVQRDAELRRATRADPWLGGQPLLLSDQHPDQGRRDPLPTARSARCAAHGCSASSTTTATATIPAASSRGCGLARRSGLRANSGEPRRRPAGRALRGRCVRELRAPRAVAGGGVRLAHGAVRAGDPPAAARQLARALSVDRFQPGCSISRAASAIARATSNMGSP